MFRASLVAMDLRHVALVGMAVAACLAVTASGGSGHGLVVANSPNCPVPGGRFQDEPLPLIARAVRSKLHLMAAREAPGSTIYGAFPLDPLNNYFVPGLRHTSYAKPVRGRCSSAVLKRSWVALVALGRNTQQANLYPMYVYVVQTRAGWRPWYFAFPNAGTGDYVPPGS